MSSVRSGVDGMIPQAPGRGAGADAGRAAVGFSAKRFLTAQISQPRKATALKRTTAST